MFTKTPTKGKQATKGPKQIYEENQATLSFYGKVVLATNAICALVIFFIFWPSFTTARISLHVAGIFAEFVCLYTMRRMAGAEFNDKGQVVDGGQDLNVQSGMPEHIKDLLILTCIVQVLSMITPFAWLLWLVAPGYLFYQLWTTILWPWFSAGSEPINPNDQEASNSPRKGFRQKRQA